MDWSKWPMSGLTSWRLILFHLQAANIRPTKDEPHGRRDSTCLNLVFYRVSSSFLIYSCYSCHPFHLAKLFAPLMLQISVMWHRACFSLFIRPSLLHLCVICRKFQLHANCSEFGHTPPRVPATFPLTSWRATHTHTQTPNRWEILLKPCFKCSTFPVTTQWTSIDTSAYATCKKCSHAEWNHSELSSVETTPMTPSFVVLATWLLHADGAISVSVILSIFFNWTVLNKSLIVWRLCWFKNVLKSADTFWLRPKLVQTGKISELIWSKKPSG